jgi:phosphoribosylformimino-5-aminoimidazole carboxamide ribotide isomerase
LIENYKTKGVNNFSAPISAKTDYCRDGIDLYKKILNSHPSIDLIASGGVSSIDDLLQLREAGCSGAIVEKQFMRKKYC